MQSFLFLLFIAEALETLLSHLGSRRVLMFLNDFLKRLGRIGTLTESDLGRRLCQKSIRHASVLRELFQKLVFNLQRPLEFA